MTAVNRIAARPSAIPKSSKGTGAGIVGLRIGPGADHTRVTSRLRRRRLLAAAALVLGLVGFEQRPVMAAGLEALEALEAVATDTTEAVGTATDEAVAEVADSVGSATATQALSLVTTVPTSTTVGSPIFANVNLMGAGVAPTGTVTFRLHGPINTACALVAFTSTVPVTGTSINSQPFVTGVAGIYRWTTTYSGDENYSAVGPTPCYAASAQITVAKIRSVLRLKALVPALGKLVATATLSGYEPNGPITFLLTGPSDVFCSRPPVFTAKVAATGAGSYNSPAFVPTLPGTYQWRATYSGDNDNLGTSTGCMNEEASVVFVI